MPTTRLASRSGRLPWLRPGRSAVLLALALTAAAAGQTADPLQSLGSAAQVLVPQGRSVNLHGGPAGVAVTSVQARVQIVGQIARTTLQVALANSSSRPEEAVLLLPVPPGAVVSELLFEGSASHPTAQVLAAAEARRLYDAIVAKVRDPALLEFAGFGAVRTSVFPVPAGGGQSIRLTWEHLLEQTDGRVDYILPRTESLAGGVPWSVELDVRAEHPISTVYSPTHRFERTRRSPRHVALRLADGGVREPGPVCVSYLLEQDDVTASLFAYPDPAVGGGYFLLMAGLPATIDEASVDREVTVVIDRSGSMAGGKLDQVRRAALQVIEGLRDGESFNIIDYASAVSAFAPRPVVKGPEATHAARRYLQRLRPGGGTNIHDALRRALAQPEPAKTDALPIVLFLTDGLPTIGTTSEVEIREMVERDNAHARRVFTIGVGADVNAPLLDRVAESTRARPAYVLPGADVELVVDQVFRRLSGPVLADCALTARDRYGDVTTRLVQELIPEHIADLFEQDQLIVLGQYRDAAPVTFTLQGSFLGRPRTFRFDFDFSRASPRNAFVPRLWASRRIAFLVDEIRQHGARAAATPALAGVAPLDDPRSRELIDEIVRLSTQFGVLTEYTAFLATEGTDLSDWNDLVLGCRHELDTKAVRTRWGVGALNQSDNLMRQKAQEQLNYRNSYTDDTLHVVEYTTVQQVCDRAFFRRGDRWIDSRLVAGAKSMDADVTITLGSPEYRALVDRLASEGRAGVLSLRGAIVIEIDGRNVLVTE